MTIKSGTHRLCTRHTSYISNDLERLQQKEKHESKVCVIFVLLHKTCSRSRLKNTRPYLNVARHYTKSNNL
jgi:hypothetical protein